MIYFIQEQSERALIKIGFTNTNFMIRLGQLQSASPDKLTLLGLMNGDTVREAKLHRLFSEVNYRAEWFYPSDELLSFIKENKIEENEAKIDKTKKRKSKKTKTDYGPFSFNRIILENRIDPNLPPKLLEIIKKRIAELAPDPAGGQ